MAAPPSVPPLVEPPNPALQQALGCASTSPVWWGHKTPPVASLWQETRATSTCTPRTPRSHPHTTAAGQPGSAQPLARLLVPLLVFVHSQTRAKQKQIPRQLKVPFLRLG